jgi:hypothetical protein
VAVGFTTTKNAHRLLDLRERGYLAYGDKSFSKSDANKVVKKLHKEGFLAQSVNLAGTRMAPDVGVRYLVMYKRGN